MKRIPAPQVTNLMTLLSGTSGSVPIGMQPITGILVWRDSPNLAYWNPTDNEWCPVNAAGFASRFHSNMPMIPNNTWAVVTSPVLAQTGGVCHHRIGPKGLKWAFRAVTMEITMPNAQGSVEPGGQEKPV